MGSRSFASLSFVVVVLVVVTLCCNYAFGFNLEPRVPIIKQGPQGSYFGYSIAQHITDTGYQHYRNSRLVIGAPKFQGSGAIFSCNITTQRSDCSALDVEDPEPLENEIRKDQWLGVTVRSQGKGGFVLACAHRNIRTGQDARWGLGACYTLTSSLDFDEMYTPCEGRSVAKAHEEFGYCQSGTSGAITEDNNALFGSPGPYTWRGTVFSISATRGISDDRQWYMGPLDTNPPVDKYSYLGMSVTHGRFFDDSVSYVSGAPRSNGTGQVVFFRKIKATPTLEIQLILSGDTFASSFGYELASVDLNNDTFLDLVVGAPFYYGKDVGGAIYVYMNNGSGFTTKTVPIKITGKPDSRFGFAIANLKDLNKDGYDDIAVGAPYENQGAVYIYLGSKDGIVMEPSQIIRSQDLPLLNTLTFGYSLSGGMDLDNNGYPDLLVGAYEVDRVILLRSRPVIGILTKVEGIFTNIDPSNTGCAADPNTNRICFSFQTCFKLTARQPQSQTFQIKYQLIAETFAGKRFSRVTLARATDEQKTRIDEDINLNRNVASEYQCQRETVYLKENTKDILNPIKFKMTYSLKQDPPRREVEGDPMMRINDYPILNQQEALRTFQATFAKDCGDNDICESDLETVVKLNLLNNALVLGTTKEVTFNITVTNYKESAYEAATFVTHPINLSFIGSKSERGQYPCTPVNKTLIMCSLGNPFKGNRAQVAEIMLRFNPYSVQDSEKELVFRVKTNSTSKEMSPEEDRIVAAKIIRKAELEIVGGETQEQVFYGGEIRGESAMKHEDEVGSHVEHNYQVMNRGPWKVGTIKVVVSWPYEVENKKKHGKWLLYLMEEPWVEGNGECVLDKEFINPLGLLKSLKKEGLDTDISSRGLFLDEQELENVLDDETEGSGFFGTRRKREVIIKPEDVEAEGRTNKVVTMDCQRGTAKCFTINCFIRDLDPNRATVIKIRARLWNSTFVEDYPDVDWVVIKSRANIELDPELNIEQNISNDYASAETKAYPDIQVSQKTQDVPIWIYIVAACCGILLLVIIVLVLWKLGFFRRKKHEAMMKGNLEKTDEFNNKEH